MLLVTIDRGRVSRKRIPKI